MPSRKVQLQENDDGDEQEAAPPCERTEEQEPQSAERRKCEQNPLPEGDGKMVEVEFAVMQPKPEPESQQRAGGEQGKKAAQEKERKVERRNGVAERNFSRGRAGFKPRQH